MSIGYARTVVLCFLFASGLLLSGCGSLAQPESQPAKTNQDTIEFIDLDAFDASMMVYMRANSPSVTVTFPYSDVAVEDLPERIQRWLSAVHNYGGGFVIQTPEGYQKKELMAVFGVIMGGYKLIKNSLPAVMGSQYRAVIVTNNKRNGIEKISFFRL